MVLNVIKRIISTFIPTTRAEMWKMEYELDTLKEIVKQTTQAQNTRIHSMEGKLGIFQRRMNEDDEAEKQEEEEMDRKQQLAQLLPVACKKMGLPDDRIGQVTALIANNPDQVDMMLSQVNKHFKFIPKNVKVEDVVLVLQIGLPVIKNLWPALGGLLDMKNKTESKKPEDGFEIPEHLQATSIKV